MSSPNIIPKVSRSQEAAFVEADLIANLKLAADFADLAIRHFEIFDDDGAKYSTDRFLDHARAASGQLKKLRTLAVKPKPDHQKEEPKP